MRVLVVDDDETLRLYLRLALESQGHSVNEAVDGVDAVEKIALALNSPSHKQSPFDVVLLDVNMPRMSGIEALQKIKDIDPRIFCLILTAYADVKDAVAAIKLGAYDYVEKPIETQRLFAIIAEAQEAKSLVAVAALSAPQVHFAEGRAMIGGSSEIKRVFDVIYKLSKVDTSVLIRGDSGTGKELVARAIHFNSSRRKGPFVAVNCAAIPDGLIESELFGHEKGSFTGADKKKLGKFQYAESGTLFLDEIGDISPSMQVKLLRVLQEKIFSAVGGNHEIKSEVRIIAATNRPLEQWISEGRFRADLFYRLNILPITLPPLKDRIEDLPALVEFMIKKFNESHNREIKNIEARAFEALCSYTWPGNIRELENVIEHAFILENSNIITLASLPTTITKSLSENAFIEFQDEHEELNLAADIKTTNESPSSELNYPALKERFEREFIIKALKAYHGRVNRTAAHTQMTKITLLRKLEKYGINPKEFHQ